MLELEILSCGNKKICSLSDRKINFIIKTLNIFEEYIRKYASNEFQIQYRVQEINIIREYLDQLIISPETAINKCNGNIGKYVKLKKEPQKEPFLTHRQVMVIINALIIYDELKIQNQIELAQIIYDYLCELIEYDYEKIKLKCSKKKPQIDDVGLEPFAWL